MRWAAWSTIHGVTIAVAVEPEQSTDLIVQVSHEGLGPGLIRLTPREAYKLARQLRRAAATIEAEP